MIFSYGKEYSTDTCHTGMRLEHIMLSERSQTQKATQCMIPFICTIGNRQIYTDKSRLMVARGLGSGKWSVTFKGNRVSFWGKENVDRKSVV